MILRASLVAQTVENLPAVQETWVGSLGWEDPMEKGVATHPIFLPGEFHGLHSPWGLKESDMTERLSLTSIALPWWLTLSSPAFCRHIYTVDAMYKIGKVKK